MGRYYAYSESDGSSFFKLATLALANAFKNTPLSLNGEAKYRTDICLNSQDASNLVEFINAAAKTYNHYNQRQQDSFNALHSVSNMHIDNEVLRHGAPHMFRIHGIYFHTNLSAAEFKEYCGKLKEMLEQMQEDLLAAEFFNINDDGANWTMFLQYPEFGDEIDLIIRKSILCSGLEYFLNFHNITHHDISGEGNEMVLQLESLKFKSCLAHENEVVNTKSFQKPLSKEKPASALKQISVQSLL